MKRILAFLLILFIIGCGTPQVVDDSGAPGDAAVDLVVAETEAVAVLESELVDEGLDALADDLEGLDW